MEYYAHISEDGLRKQTVQEHLDGTARLCQEFAADFGAEAHGEVVGLAHDIGKHTAAFQRRFNGGCKVDHATAGAIECYNIRQPLSACVVIGHHSGLPDFGNPTTDTAGDSTYCGRLKKGQNGGIEPYHWDGSLPDPGPVPLQDPLALSYWVRMLYSCLVDADYLDTEHFMKDGKADRGGYDSLETLMDRLNRHIQKWADPQSELNANRWRILRSCLDAGKKPRGLYSLTVPTGGGKTVSSLAFALKHAVENGLKRVIYVIPYTSIIEQNAQVFREILGQNNVVEHHSGLTLEDDKESTPRMLATENWDAPVIVTTAVQFFESMYANRSSKCRKLHNIANSVIIFDEAQMIPVPHLRPCVAAIAHLVRDFRATAVLCTATQPSLNGLFREFAPELAITELCPGTQDLYDRFRRVTFHQAGLLTNEALARELTSQAQVLCIVNSRKAAQTIYDLLPHEGSYHLSTLMYPAHRQAVLAQVRQRLTAGEPCRVVSTSLIEAGVDVDFPVVYREKAGLDSILQAAGRCNREGKRPVEESIVTIFEGETPAPKLFQMNIGACSEALSALPDPGSPDAVALYFRSLLSFVGEGTDKYHIIEGFQRGISGCLLPFRQTAEKFRLIDNATKTVYIPLGDGEAAIDAIAGGYASRADYRKAGRYSVAIYDGHYRKLEENGCLEPLPDGESGILRDLSKYSQATGLATQFDTGIALFI